ncbi:MAG: hypothetical protein KAR42_13955 [candidate division Zixibacteria bacterium]|nr:hypothetical protein [candidate division Zixibacteria bacterium]
MQCREVSKQIQRMLHKELNGLDNSALKHIKQCSKCYHEYTVVQALRTSYKTVREMPKQDIIPFTEIKNTVENSVNGLKKNPDSRSWGFRKPVLSFSLGTLFVVFCLFALIPFQYSKTIGYEVAFAGVDITIVEEDNFICDILCDLGLHDADVDVKGCNVTCSLLIIDLASKEDAEKVVEAFTLISDHNITSNVIPIKARKSATLLNRANDKILSSD